MLFHILGYGTLVAQGVTAVGVAAWLRVAARDSRTWLRPLRVPRVAEITTSSSAGPQGFSDYVGLI